MQLLKKQGIASTESKAGKTDTINCEQMGLRQTQNVKLCILTIFLLVTKVLTAENTNPINPQTEKYATQKSKPKPSLPLRLLSNPISGKFPYYSPILTSKLEEISNSFSFAPENCGNGIDDDGDGFIDGADPDCGCLQTVMMVARDNGQILSVNLATGGTSSVATSSPYVTGNLNALAANPDDNLVYYCAAKKVYYWVPSTGTHGLVVDLNGQIGATESLSSGGGEYYNGYLYLGTEKGNPGISPNIYRVQLSANGKSAVGSASNLNIPIPNQLSWGDLIATTEAGQVVLYCMAASSTSYFFKYNVNTATYTLIRNDLPTEMQIGVDINGNTWAGSLSSGMIQKIDRQTGYFYGNIINFGGKIWDMTGPINCPQAIEICGNGLDDDNDGYTDNQDQDCLCPSITANDATTRTICEGETVSFNVTSNAPNPPYSYIEYYRFDTPQTNPYTSADAKTWLGEFTNSNGTGVVYSANFPNSSSSNNATYYVYGCVKPAPPYPEICAPLVAYTVTVKPSPTANAGSDISLCANSSASITASGLNAPIPMTYNWSNGLGAGASKTVTPNVNTTYTVTVTAANGCTSTDNMAIIVNPAPTVNAGSDVSLCIGTSTILSANASNGVAPYTYQWNNGLGTGASQTVSPSTSKTYSVTATGANGCIASDAVVVNVTNCTENCANGLDDDGDGFTDCADSYCSISIDANSYFCICQGEQVTMSVSASGASGNYTYTWSHGLGSGQFKNVAPTTTTDYTVTVTPTIGCTSTALIHVAVLPCPEECSNGLDDDFDGLFDCADPDCVAVGTPQLANDTYTTCPGTVLTERVTYNDNNLQDPAYSIVSMPTNGTVTIDGTGKFLYTPSGQTCGLDAFIYQVCNQSSTCCSQATVTLLLGDVESPTLQNVPADLTISCDDAVPNPSQVLAYDACPGIYIHFEETTNEHVNGACSSFTITRTWTATDLCGNETIGDQIITIQDQTPPELQRLYTLPNGKKLISGIAALSSERWKYVSFPNTFASIPVVVAQLTSNLEIQAATVQIRNISTQGFELRLAEEEGSIGAHTPETVSWMAMEKGGAFTSSYALEAGTISNVTNSPAALNFGLSFSTTPTVIAAQQTTNEVDAATPRIQNITPAGAQVFASEEKSKDTETNHIGETMAYLAFTAGTDITDVNGDLVGEIGSLSLTNSWANLQLRNRYTKPIVIMGGISTNDAEPVTIRVMNVTPSSFDARLQEWSYQDGTHSVEQVGYMVLEGSIPAEAGYYCSGKPTSLVVGQTLFAHDNCDDQVEFGSTQLEEMQANGLLTTRAWVGIDDCGKINITSRNDTCTIAAVRIKTILNGPYVGNNSSNFMRDDLRVKGILPNLEPYSTLANFTHKGKGGGEVIAAGLLNVTGANAIVDWVFVEIRDSSNSHNVLATMSALLQRDGDVVSANGDDVLYFPTLPEGNYYVAVRHRNHIGMMADATLWLNSMLPPLADFTSESLGVKGWNEAGKTQNGKRTCWAGDLNGDRKVIYQGPNNDIFYLFSRVVGDPLNATNLANFISTGYDKTDLNLDGRSIYQGPNNERATLLYNTILAHPTNYTYLSNFIAREYLP